MTGPRRSERGQSSVEFALVLPILMVVVVALVQVGVVVMTKLAVSHTAREVARVLAVDPSADPHAIAAIARPFGSGPLEIEVRRIDAPSPGRSLIEVRIADRVEGMGSSLVPQPTVSTTVAMLSE